MKGKYTFINVSVILITALLFAACAGGNDIAKRYDVVMEEIELLDSSWFGMGDSLCGFHNGEFYAMVKKNDGYKLQFSDEKGNITREYNFDKGKGPGETMFPASITLADENICIYDSWMEKISLFDPEGEFIDSYLLDGIGDHGSITVIDNAVYYHGLALTFFLKYDFSTEEEIKRVPHSEKMRKSWFDMDARLKTPVEGGCLAAGPDKKRLYIGYWNMPYRVDEFDLDLNKLRTFTRTLDRNYKPLQGSFGERLISGIQFYDNELLASFGTGTYLDGDDYKACRDPFFITVFDMNDPARYREIVCEELSPALGTRLIGVDDDWLYVLVIALQEDMETIVGKPVETEKLVWALAKIKNPL